VRVGRGKSLSNAIGLAGKIMERQKKSVGVYQRGEGGVRGDPIATYRIECLKAKTALKKTMRGERQG